MDLSPEMLAAGGAPNVIAGDVRSMPFASERFDMVWCRLVLGYLPDALPAYLEFARVCKPGVVMSLSQIFTPTPSLPAIEGTFTAPDGTVHDIEHYVHNNHLKLAREAGLSAVSSWGWRGRAVDPPLLC